jgi:hypothetical protein
MVRTNPAAAKLARRIESLMDEIRPAADSDPKLALASLMLGLHDLVDALDLPRIAGGAPDDAEADPESWPARTDNWFWEPQHAGPTPLGVLATSAPEWEPTADDLAEMASWSAGLFTEADAMIVHGV